MPQQRNLSAMKTKRSTILHLWNIGHRSPTTIARMTKIPLRTIKYNIAKIKEQGTIEDRPRLGRPRKITANDNQALGQWIRRNNEITSQELSEKLLHDRDLNISRWTVQRQLHRMGYKSTLPHGTPMLTQEQKDARVQWAIKHQNDDWSRTIFTDETCYQLFRNTIRRWSRNPKAEVKRIPKNKQKIMVWGSFSIKGLVGYHSFNTIMDGPYYVQILQDHLIHNARKQFGRRYRLQQDNDPKHKSRVAQQFISNEVPEVIDWPSNSPDVNPVENLWSIIKRRVEKRKPANLQELDIFLHEEWKKTDMLVLNHLVNSMKSRCLALIEAKGERINY
jgi:transposase